MAGKWQIARRPKATHTVQTCAERWVIEEVTRARRDPDSIGDLWPARGVPDLNAAVSSTLHRLTADNCRSKREGFAGRDNLGAIKSLPRTANPNREKSGPRLGFLGSGRNLKSLPFGLRNYRL